MVPSSLGQVSCFPAPQTPGVMSRVCFIVGMTAVGTTAEFMLPWSRLFRTSIPAMSLLHSFVFFLLSTLVVWPAVVFFNDLRNARVARHVRVELTPRVKTGSFLNVGFIYHALNYKNKLSPGKRLDHFCGKWAHCPI
jgi:hypothetical protein